MSTRKTTGLARALSTLGVGSRSHGFERVRGGRVSVNGTVRRNLEFPVRPSDRILVDDAPLIAPTQIYLMMNNPGGLVMTASD